MLFFSLQLISNLWANTLGLRSTLFLIQHSPTCFKINLLTVFPTPSLLPYSIFIPFTFSWHSIYLFIYDFISIWTCRLFYPVSYITIFCSSYCPRRVSESPFKLATESFCCVSLIFKYFHYFLCKRVSQALDVFSLSKPWNQPFS